MLDASRATVLQAETPIYEGSKGECARELRKEIGQGACVTVLYFAVPGYEALGVRPEKQCIDSGVSCTYI